MIIYRRFANRCLPYSHFGHHRKEISVIEPPWFSDYTDVGNETHLMMTRLIDIHWTIASESRPEGNRLEPCLTKRSPCNSVAITSTTVVLNQDLASLTLTLIRGLHFADI